MALTQPRRVISKEEFLKEMARQANLAGWENQILHPMLFLQEQEQLEIRLPDLE